MKTILNKLKTKSMKTRRAYELKTCFIKNKQDKIKIQAKENRTTSLIECKART
jgi:hypothetical protein